MLDDFIPENNFPDRPEAASPAPSGAMPDGIGLSMDEVKALIARQHHEVLDGSDPVLMLVSILNAFLAEQAKLGERHKQALSKVMAEHTDGYVRNVKTSVDGLAEQISGSSAEALKKVLFRASAQLITLKRDLQWLALAVIVAAAVNIIAMVVRVYA